MIGFFRLGCGVLLMTLLACSGGGDGGNDGGMNQPEEEPSIQAPGDGPRDKLTAGALNGTPRSTGFVHNGYYMPVGEWEPAQHTLQGTLTVPATPFVGRADSFPGFSVDFFQWEDHLVPTVRTMITDNPYQWSLILSPGRVWYEPDDGDWSRASFPFVLADAFINQTHNGIATFLYDGQTVSNFQLQIVQENASFNIFVAHAQGPANFEAKAASAFDIHVTAYAQERADAFPVADWESLGTQAGGALNGLDNGSVSNQITYKGIVMDGVLYRPVPETLLGPYPYPDAMRAGAFSVTKSMGAAVALLRLAQVYGVDVYDLKVADYLNVGASHDGWRDVTFVDCLNMATGIGDNSPTASVQDLFADENQSLMGAWGLAESTAEKLAICWQYGDYPWGPDEVVRYNTTHTFVLAAAMDAYLKTERGPDAHLWHMVADEVFAPIGIHHAPMMHTWEPDGARGVPILGVGAFPTMDDLAKVTTLLQNGGRHEGQQLLEPTHLADALFRSQANSALTTGRLSSAGDPLYYHHSFWSYAHRLADGCVLDIPYMSGFGGNLVVMYPNGLSGFRFADNDNFQVQGIAQALQALRPHNCP